MARRPVGAAVNIPQSSNCKSGASLNLPKRATCKLNGRYCSNRRAQNTIATMSDLRSVLSRTGSDRDGARDRSDGTVLNRTFFDAGRPI
jgi:hypothetical protein